MKRRIICNILLAFVLLPLIKLAFTFTKMEINGDYSAYSGSFYSYLKIIALTVFFTAPILFSVFVLLPYNAIIIKKINLNFIYKIFLFEAILIVDLCILGTFMNLWYFPYWKNVYYLAYFIPYSLLFTGLIHVFVDRREIKTIPK